MYVLRSVLAVIAPVGAPVTHSGSLTDEKPHFGLRTIQHDPTHTSVEYLVYASL